MPIGAATPDTMRPQLAEPALFSRRNPQDVCRAVHPNGRHLARLMRQNARRHAGRGADLEAAEAIDDLRWSPLRLREVDDGMSEGIRRRNTDGDERHGEENPKAASGVPLPCTP